MGPQTLSRTFGGMVAKFALAQWGKRDFWFVMDHLQAPEELPQWSTEVQGQKAGLDIEGLAPGEPLLSLSGHARAGSAGLSGPTGSAALRFCTQ